MRGDFAIFCPTQIFSALSHGAENGAQSLGGKGAVRNKGPPDRHDVSTLDTLCILLVN